MKKMILIPLTLLMLLVAAPAFAKDFNLPEGVSRIYYSSGEGIIETPADWPSGAFHPTRIYILAQQIEVGSLGSDADGIAISVPSPLNPSILLPIAYFTTSPDAVAFVTTLFSGMPLASFPGNSRLVSESVLRVERHGNRIIAELTDPQIILWFKVGRGVIPLSLPAFTFQVDNVGGSFHDEDITSYTGYPGASGYTSYEEEMGFRAEGVFTCPGWKSEMSNCWIIMHGITTYVPPG